MSTYRSFAVVGAGTIGLPIATGLAAKGVTVIILSRGSTKTPPSGVQLVQVDTSDAAAVTAVLKQHKVDVVVSTINAASTEGAAAQKPVVDAAKAAAVRLYVPSEFGCPSDGQTEGFPGAKNELAEYAKSVGVPSARVYTGLFTEYIPFVTGHAVNGKARYMGKGDTPVSFTSIGDITGFTVHALTTLPPSKLENRILRLEGDRATLKEVAAKFNTPSEPVESVEGEEFITNLLRLFESGGGSSGWDEANKRDGTGDQAAGSANALWAGHHWQSIKEVHGL
ncbi:hypothetical protein C8R46DRAFT_1065851 [Mycena filopes]|nr:hypothetical protein C8R46DRAFT_1065851 [Mycena filopes]